MSFPSANEKKRIPEHFLLIRDKGDQWQGQPSGDQWQGQPSVDAVERVAVE